MVLIYNYKKVNIMNLISHKKLIIVIVSLLSLIFLSSCTSVSTKSLKTEYEGQTVYNKVGLHAEWRRNVYISFSTNYLGIPNFFKINTEFQVKKITEKEIILTQIPKNENLVIKYIYKHNRMPLRQYIEENFSKTKVTLPSSITKDEKKQIELGQFDTGMSREALFYSIGYPPASLNSDRNAKTLIYQSKRFKKVKFNFNEMNKILIQNETE